MMLRRQGNFGSSGLINFGPLDGQIIEHGIANVKTYTWIRAMYYEEYKVEHINDTNSNPIPIQPSPNIIN